MAVLIDASILIEAERGRLHLEPHVARHGEDEAFLSVVTASELLHGVHAPPGPTCAPGARPSSRASSNASRCSPSTSLARGLTRSSGPSQPRRTLIGPHDLWLAATCVAHGLTMVTGNVREFARVPGLEIEVWEG